MADLVKVLNVKADIGDAQQKMGKLQLSVKKLGDERRRLNKDLKAGRISEKQYGDAIAKNTIATKKAQMGVRQYSKSILVANGAMKKTSGFVMGIRKALTGMAGQFLGVMAAFMLVKNVIGVFKDFEQANADLAAVLGKSREEISELTEDAKRLGGVTAFTATEVSQLQKEFAKLGFNEQEILDATKATLDLAAATGTELARAAEVAGSTTRAFGLDASETQRVTDVMAKSFSSSALDMEKFATSMRNVAPVAKNAGLNIEQTTAMLGVLTDRGIDASTSGTALRNVFLELSKKGLSFEEAMEKINTSTDKNKTAMELFGKRGAVVGSILAETGDSVEDLTEKLNNAAGEAKAMAETQLDTLDGKLTLLGSAWEGFVLNIEDGNGVISRTLQNMVEGLTDVLVIMSKLGTSTEEIINEAGVTAGKEQLESFFAEFKTGEEKIVAARKALKNSEGDLKSFDEAIVRLNENFKEAAKTDPDDLLSLDKISEEINKMRLLRAERETFLNGLKELVAEKEKEEQLDLFRLKTTEDLTFLAAQNIEVAKIVLAERIKATEDAAEAESGLTDKEKKELKKRQKERDKAAKKQLELEQKNAQLRLQIAAEEAQAKVELLIKEHDAATKTDKERLDAILSFSESEAELRLLKAETLEEERLARIEKENADFQTEMMTRKVHLNETAEQKKAFDKETELLHQKHKEKLDGIDTEFQAKSTQRHIQEVQAVAGTLNAISTLSKEGSMEQKALQTAIATMNTYSAAVAAIAAPPTGYGPTPIGYAAMASAIITGFGQVAKIQGIQFARGGVLQGKSHARGGIPTIDGQYEFEGGEAVINKRSTAKYGALLSSINQAGGGVAFSNGGITKFQQGGIPAPISFPESPTDISGTTEQFVSQMDTIKVVNVVTDTTEQQASVLNVTNEAEIG